MNPIESPLRVLVADDNDAMLRLLVRALGERGVEVLQAADGAELMHWVDAAALRDAAAPLFDLVISDQRMPGASGLQALRRLRAHGLATPLILMTAFGDERLHREALAAGATAVLDKPLDLAQLRAVVHALQ